MDYSKAVKCAILSQEVYGEFSQLQFSEFPDIAPELIDLESTDTQGAIFGDSTGSSIYIVFRGSENRIDWDTNFNLEQEVVKFQKDVLQKKVVGDREQVYPYEEESRSGAKMHRGFASAYMSVREQIHNYLNDRAAPSLTVTGHSLGGALATLCAVDIQYNFSNKVTVDIYTFGAPRVGNNGFKESFNRRVPNSYRFVYGMDIVPALPRPWQGYRHVDTEYRLGSRLSINFFSQRFKDHSIANYINALKELA
ncbi:lipase family protein [Candidatus Gracilibacteria bacterium]|jgi:triacylglycerol lipase|nr:lipase family protein [Candidatus Gracilibacteria bacterium]NJM86053.1 lipase family protein [Hydrococcus sp. RU_2_2]NJP20201.1 lipase family protein [Hydrococcus sp. CRU_1_1]